MRTNRAGHALPRFSVGAIATAGLDARSAGDQPAAEEYNGLHLVLLATSEGVTRSLVHTDRPDPYLVREAQAIGAFFERTERLLHAVVGYLHFDLPQRDRRNSDRYDRRTAFRGGRRAADIALPA